MKHPINGFKLISAYCRKEKLHGGTAVFVAEHLQINMSERIDLNKCAEYVDGRKRLVIILLYRIPDSSVRLFLEKLEDILMRLTSESSNFIIACDINLDLLGTNNIKYDFVALLDSKRARDMMVFRLSL